MFVKSRDRTSPRLQDARPRPHEQAIVARLSDLGKQSVDKTRASQKGPMQKKTKGSHGARKLLHRGKKKSHPSPRDAHVRRES